MAGDCDVAEGVLTQPYFYFSLDHYCDTLQRVRTHGDWAGWLRFHLIGADVVVGQ